MTKKFIFTYSQPKEFSLEQNYPNPFNPVTKIRYSIPSNVKGEMSNVGSRSASTVQLKVYDVLGNEVATLVNEEKQSGYYEVELDASRVSNGVYIYRLMTSNYVSTKKMILLH